MQKREKKRYRYIDYSKAILMIYIILAHTNYANYGIIAWLKIVSIPAFFAVSGFMLKSDSGYSLPEVRFSISKRIQSVVFPFFIWALIYAKLTPRNVAMILYGSHFTLGKAGSLTSLWYLNTLFVALLYFEASKLLFKDKLKLPVKIGLMAVAFVVFSILPNFRYQYPWNLNVALFAFGSLLLGNVLFPVITAFKRKIDALDRWKGVAVCVAVIALTFAGTLLYRFNIPEGRRYLEPSEGIFGNVFLSVVVTLFGLLCTVALSILLDIVLPKKEAVLSFIGKNTLCILVVHKPLVRILFKDVFRIIHVPDPIVLIVTCVGTLAISCGIALFINRFIPFMVGRFPRKETV